MGNVMGKSMAFCFFFESWVFKNMVNDLLLETAMVYNVN